MTFDFCYFQFVGWKKHATALWVRLRPTYHQHIPQREGRHAEMHIRSARVQVSTKVVF